MNDVAGWLLTVVAAGLVWLAIALGLGS